MSTSSSGETSWKGVALIQLGVIVAGWIWQTLAYVAPNPNGGQRSAVWVAWIPWFGIVGALLAVSLYFSIGYRSSWDWRRQVLCWLWAVILLAQFTVTSIILQLSITGLSPAH